MQELQEKVKDLLKEPDEQFTIVSIILDESGSMRDCLDATLNGFNEYVKNLQAQSKEIALTLTTFNSAEIKTRYVARPIGIVGLLDEKNYVPNEMTPLYDAIVKTVRLTEDAITGFQKSPAVLCVIITDGLENSSHQNKREDVLKLVQEKERQGWTFVYLGANQDAWQVGQTIGMVQGNTKTYTVNQTETMYAALAKSTGAYLMANSDKTVNFFKDDETCQQKSA